MMNEVLNFSTREWSVQSARLLNEWVIHNSFAIDGNWTSLSNLSIDRDAFLAFLTQFFEQEPTYIETDVDTNKIDVTNAVWICSDQAFSITFWHKNKETGRHSFNWYYKGYHKERLEKLRLKCTEMAVKDTPTGQVYMLAASQSGLEFRGLPTLVQSPLEKNNYTPDVLKGYERAKRDLEAVNPSGRITIFDGQPGTGKTYVVKALLSEVDPTRTAFVFLASSLMAELATPNFIPAILDFSQGLSGKSITFIVEDADECIAPRDGANMSAVSSVLNFGDGIIGSLLDIRLVMTTNAKRQHIDPAIMRPGRLSSMIKIEALPAEQASEVYKRLTDKEMSFDAPKTLAEVYSLAFDSGWIPPATVTAKSPIGFASPQPSLSNKSVTTGRLVISGR